MKLQIKRAYDPPGPEDGFRILIDRLWPRGVSKSAAKIDLWLKEAAPSTALRQWFGHDPAKWEQLKERYFKELAAHEDALREIRTRARKGQVTIVYGARDTERNNAVALVEFLKRK